MVQSATPEASACTSTIHRYLQCLVILQGKSRGLQSCNAAVQSVQAFSEIPQLWNMRGNSRIQLQGSRLSERVGQKGLCHGARAQAVRSGTCRPALRSEPCQVPLRLAKGLRSQACRATSMPSTAGSSLAAASSVVAAFGAFRGFATPQAWIASSWRSARPCRAPRCPA